MVVWLAPAIGAAEPKVAGKRSDPVQATLDRVGQMAPAAQQAWLKRLEQRAAHAAQVMLKPEEAALQQADIRAKLHQKTVTWQVLRDMIKDTDRREQEAIDRLVRRYRSMVFDSFHKQLDVYGQRQQAWVDIHLNWKLAGGQFEQQDRLIAWLEQAIRSVTPNAIGPIPEKPLFLLDKLRAETASQPAAKDEKPQAPPNSETIDKPKADLKQPPAEETPKRPAKDANPPERPKAKTSADKPNAAAVTAPPQTAAAKQSSAGATDVKTDELNARINRCNLAFRALETDLDEKGDWTAARLESLVARLKLLVTRRHDLNLSREAVPEQQRASVKPLASTKSVLAQFAVCIAAAKAHASDAAFADTDAERQAELKRLDGLSSRLAKLTGE
jgi:hypothetical protein